MESNKFLVAVQDRHSMNVFSEDVSWSYRVLATLPWWVTWGPCEIHGDEKKKKRMEEGGLKV